MREPFNLAELAFDGVTITTKEAAALARPLELAWIGRIGGFSATSRSRAIVLGRMVNSPRHYVIIKCFSAARPRDTEVGCYNALESMQGKDIPVLIEAEYEMPNWFSAMIGKSFKFAMVISFISDTYRAPSCLLAEGMEVCRKVVRQMHLLGVSHGKPSVANILFNRVENKAVIIDFTKGQTLAKVGEKKFSKAITNDMTIIDKEIDFYEQCYGSNRGKKRSLSEV